MTNIDNDGKIETAIASAHTVKYLFAAAIRMPSCSCFYVFVRQIRAVLRSDGHDQDLLAAERLRGASERLAPKQSFAFAAAAASAAPPSSSNQN